MRWIAVVLAVMLAGLAARGAEPAGDVREIALIATSATHGYGEHENTAAPKFLAKLLNEHGRGVHATVYEGFPKDAKLLEKANAIVFFADGGGGNPVLKNMDALRPLMARGVGLGLFHWALDVGKGPQADEVRGWMGGTFEPWWSVNPFWTPKFAKLPEHAVTRGVRPFAIHDEWYFHMRFVEKQAGVTPLLTGAPGGDVRNAPDSEYSGNATVRAEKGQVETLAWAYERPGGGRGFGFTGLHSLWNLAQNDYRTLVLNALVWLSGAEVPKEGVVTPRPTAEQLMEMVTRPRPKDLDAAKIQALLPE